MSKNVDSLVSRLATKLEQHVRAELDRGNHLEVASAATLAAALQVFSERNSDNAIDSNEINGEIVFSLEEGYLSKTVKSGPTSLPYKHRVPLRQAVSMLEIALKELDYIGCVTSKVIQEQMAKQHTEGKVYQIQLALSWLVYLGIIKKINKSEYVISKSLDELQQQIYKMQS